MGNNVPKELSKKKKQAYLIKARLEGLVIDALSLVLSREKQKQLLETSLYRNGLYLVITNLAGPVTSFFYWILVARFYSTNAVGLGSATSSIVTLLGLFSTLGFEFGLVRYLSNAGHNSNRMVNTSLTIGSITAFAFSSIFLAAIMVFSPALEPLRQNPVYITSFIIFTVITTITVLIGNVFIAERHANFTMTTVMISNILELSLISLFILFMRSFEGILVAMVTSGTIALVVSMMFFLPKTLPDFRPVPTINRSVVNEMIRFSFTNYISNMLLTFTIYVLPIMVVNVLGAEANAYFFISWTTGGVLGTISLATTTSLFAEGSFDEKKLVSDIWRCLKMTYIILIPSAAIVFTLSDKLLLIFGIAYSLKGTTLLRIVSIASLPLALNFMYISILRIQKKSMALILLTLFIAILTLTIAYILLPRIGITATGIGWLVSQSLVAVFVASKLLKLRKTGQF